MFIISISHKTAPLSVRELFSFDRRQQEEFLRMLSGNKHFQECVLVSTCNRSEIYFTGDHQAIELMQALMADYKQQELELFRRYFLIYQEEKAIQHLFCVTCGMDSMVLGEDEILGQVKTAYELSLQVGMTGYLLNTLFQSAITCAKRIKTDTRLSKTPVSVGTLAANEALRFQGVGKNVLIIGLTGKMGSIIMKNLYGKDNIQLSGTSRSHNRLESIGQDYEKVHVIDYKERYQYLDESDVIISATTSPHYTLTYHELAQYIHTSKERLFLDLAVPMDIDKDIVKIPGVKLLDIDYFETASNQNSAIREQESILALELIEEYIDSVKKEISFHDFLKELPRISQLFEEHSFQQLLYDLKGKATSEELDVMMKLLLKL